VLRGPKALHSLGWVALQGLVICVPLQSHSVPAEARSHEGVRASSALPRGRGIDNFCITEFLYYRSQENRDPFYLLKCSLTVVWDFGCSPIC